MNKNKLCYLITLILTAALLISGCEEQYFPDEYSHVNVPEEKLNTIETFEIGNFEIKNDQNPVNQPYKTENRNAFENIELSLEECRLYTLNNNLELKAQLIEPDISAERIKEQNAKFEPSFTASTQFTQIDTPVNNSTGIGSEKFQTDVGLDIPLRTGGTVSFHATDSRTKTDPATSTTNPAYETDFSVSISHPLLKNAGKKVNNYSIQIARYEHQIVGARTKLEIIRVLALAEQSYWRFYAAQKDLEVSKEQYELADAQLQRAKRLVRSGEMPLVEIIRAEAGVAARLESIIVAENNLRDRERELKRILNHPNMAVNSSTVITTATQPNPVHYDLPRQMLLETAMKHRMELLELELQIAQDYSAIEYRQNQILPLVTLDYTYNINGFGESRSGAYSNAYDNKFDDHSIGLQLMIPLGNQSAKSSLMQAFYQRQARIATFENRKSLIEIEVLNAADQLEANWQRILATRQNAILSGRLYHAEKRQFELGTRTSTDVLDAQTKFSDAQRAEIQALAEYEMALIDLAYATGTLLGTSQVQIF